MKHRNTMIRKKNTNQTMDYNHAVVDEKLLAALVIKGIKDTFGTARQELSQTLDMNC